MDWNDLRYVLALGRRGSVRAAGEALGVSHSTVARRVDALEVRLQARLFERTRGGYTPTDAGRQVIATAERIEAELAGVERQLAGADARLSGPVHLTVWDSVVASMLLPGLSRFCEDHPGVELQLSADPRSVDLSLREADVALRVYGRGTTPPDELIGRILAPLAVRAYVARDSSRCDPAGTGDRKRMLGYDDPESTETLKALSPWPELPIWGCFGTMETMLEATRAGLGIGMMPCYVGDRCPDLRTLPASTPLQVADVWLLSHPDLRTTARLQRLRAHVAGQMDLLRRWFAGDGPSMHQPVL